jgi:hypothetical protein
MLTFPFTKFRLFTQVLILFIDRGIHIEHDPKQNRYSGLPDAWKAAIPAQCQADDGMKSDIPEFLIPTNHKVMCVL